MAPITIMLIHNFLHNNNQYSELSLYLANKKYVLGIMSNARGQRYVQHENMIFIEQLKNRDSVFGKIANNRKITWGFKNGNHTPFLKVVDNLIYENGSVFDMCTQQFRTIKSYDTIRDT